MIIQITGNVQFNITLDPSVWIFDDRKISFEEAFTLKAPLQQQEEDEIREASLRWDREVYQQKLDPPINQSISSFEKKKIIIGTYVMPLVPFLDHANINNNATKAILETKDESVEISLEKAKETLLLFAQNGHPLKEDGPVHVYFHDGSNKQSPIKGLKKIIIQ